jgi:hypothetical protein
MADDAGVFWTLQQFWTGPTGKPWYALQKQNDEIDAICKEYGITPEELPPTTEEEFLKRAMGELPDDPHRLSGGRGR